jgi:AraC-like DNA-binding protein
MVPEPARYREHPVRGVPGALVWARRTAAGGEALVLPDGCMDLLWIGDRLLVAGPDTRAYLAAGLPGGTIAGVRFFPGTAPGLLGVPARELLDRRAELADLWPAHRMRAAAATVAAAGDPADGLAELARRCVAGTAPADPLLPAIVHRLRAGTPVGCVADALGLNARRLHRISLAAFGYGPKTLSRVLRLQHALTLSRAGIPLSRIAIQAGYADQAHLTREVRTLTGRPPARLFGAAPGGT